VWVFGSSLFGLATKGSDMDLTLLFNQYLIENQYKQVKMPKIVVRNLNKQNQNNSNGSSNGTDAIETEIDENVDEMIEEENTNHNNSDLSLKECIEKFFVRFENFKF
jgi:hypothetical protein